MSERWTLHLGDCIEGMRSLADDSVDVTITDPPYDEHTHSKGRRGNSIAAHAGARESRAVAERAAISRNRDLGFAALTPAQMRCTAEACARTTRRWSLFFCSLEMISDWRGAVTAAGLEYVRTCVWHKVGSTPQFTGDRPAIAVEAIVVAHRPGRKCWNGGGKHGYYRHSIVLERGHGEVRLHTTQKPLSLMRELVEDFTEPDELVLDPYSGSATTAVAALQLGRRFIGWELDANYHAIACRRLRGDEAKPNDAQPSLAFGGTP